MKTVRTVKLEDLSKVLKEQNKIENVLTKEQIDGTAFTDNPIEKYRKSRVVSPVKKWRRPQDIQGFLNYCKYRIGEKTEKVKPKAIWLSVLTGFKKDDFDSMSTGYKEACKDFEDLVRKAAFTDLRKLNGNNFKKSSKSTGRKLKKFTIEGYEISTYAKPDQTIKCAKNFIEWLDLQMIAAPWTIDDSNRYLKVLRAYSLNSQDKTIAPVYKQILKQNSWILDNYQFEKLGKKLILSRKAVNTKEQTIEQINKSVVVKEKTSDKSLIDSFISQLKLLGVKEFSIKF